jgi:hypothetical protein
MRLVAGKELGRQRMVMGASVNMSPGAEHRQFLAERDTFVAAARPAPCATAVSNVLSTRSSA